MHFAQSNKIEGKIEWCHKLFPIKPSSYKPIKSGGRENNYKISILPENVLYNKTGNKTYKIICAFCFTVFQKNRLFGVRLSRILWRM